MIKRILSLLLFISFQISSAQSREFFEEMKFPKATLNELLTAYTVSYTLTENGVEEENMPEPRVDNPHFIYIKSDGENGQILIRNKNQKKDLIMEFTYIYKRKDDGDTWYHFIFKDSRYSGSYIDLPIDNDILMITFEESENAQLDLFYTISKI